MIPKNEPHSKCVGKGKSKLSQVMEKQHKKERSEKKKTKKDPGEDAATTANTSENQNADSPMVDIEDEDDDLSDIFNPGPSTSVTVTSIPDKQDETCTPDKTDPQQPISTGTDISHMTPAAGGESQAIDDAIPQTALSSDSTPKIEPSTTLPGVPLEIEDAEEEEEEESSEEPTVDDREARMGN